MSDRYDAIAKRILDYPVEYPLSRVKVGIAAILRESFPQALAAKEE